MKSEQELMQVNMSIRKVKPFFKEDKRPSDLSTAEEALNRSIHTKMDLLHLKYKEKAAQLGSNRRPRPERDSREEHFYRGATLAGDTEPQTYGQPGAGDTYKQGLGVPLADPGNRPKFSLGRGYQAGFDK